jgi:Tol biopolymer transport system component
MRLRVGDWVIEYPAGRALYHGPGWPGPARVSPNGDLIAFIEHPILDDDAGFVMTVDRHGHARKLTDEWASLSGLAWNPGGTEIWFTAAKQGVNRDVYAVSMKRNLRRIASMPAPLRLFDISSSGRVLLGRSVAHMSMFIGDMQSQAATETSWLDWSHVVAVSADGQSVLFDESGEGGGPLYTAYVYRRDRNTAERIGSGRAMDISEDGQSILTGSHLDPSTLKLLTLAKTEERTIRAPGLTYQSAKFVPRSHDIVVQATDECEPMRTYLQNVDTGKLHRLATADGMSSITPSPDGKQIAGSISPKEIGLVNLVTGERTVIVAEESSMPVEWSSDDELVLQVHRGTGPVVLQKLNIRNRRATKIKEIPQQGELASAESCKFVVRVSRNLKTFAYSQLHIATGLFAVDGWS